MAREATGRSKASGKTRKRIADSSSEEDEIGEDKQSKGESSTARIPANDNRAEESDDSNDTLEYADAQAELAPVPTANGQPIPQPSATPSKSTAKAVPATPAVHIQAPVDQTPQRNGRVGSVNTETAASRLQTPFTIPGKRVSMAPSASASPLKPRPSNIDALNRPFVTKSQSKLDMPAAKPAIVAAVPRLVIHMLVLVNFKSYAGRIEIGPFHSSFSAIVGPNGSGKSNTIDALLFVFGWRANKMRQGKLSELIHNSEGRMNLDSCSVEVHFREIIDLPGEGNYSIVPNSNLVVTRTALRNNSSKYTINNRTSNFTEVTTLLKGKGIDLDHKRFLILQGEVESIAQMKPKAPNEHEDGLLEYLEDIIGTSRFKEPIEKANEEVDKLNEERGVQMNRVKLVEKEKSRLESDKKEADSYLRDQNLLTVAQSKMYQWNRWQAVLNLGEFTEQYNGQMQTLERERAAQSDQRQAAEAAQAEYDARLEEVKQVEVDVKRLEKEIAVFDKQEASMQEQKKHFATKQKKLKKQVSDDTHAKTEAASNIRDRRDEVAKLTGELAKIEKQLSAEEALLDEIRDSLKGKTEGISAQIEEKQKALQPWTKKILAQKAKRNKANSELDVIKRKNEDAKAALQESKTNLVKLGEQEKRTTEEVAALKTEKAQVQKKVSDMQDQLNSLHQEKETIKQQLSIARSKAEEARSSQQAKSSQSRVLADLNKLKDMGKIPGFFGRLGDLGRIDDKYDVAVSTASPGLNNLVCDTVETGQECLEHLRKTKSGRAHIMCLRALAQRDLSVKDTPESVPRLFDLVTPKDAKYKSAFYELMRDTLVAKDLDQANRIAFGSGKRWRVVTLDGNLIDVSGTMSGGGTRKSSGLMSARMQSSDVVRPEMVAKLEKEQAALQSRLQEATTKENECESGLADVKRRPSEIDLALAKLEMSLRNFSTRRTDAESRISELESQMENGDAQDERVSELEQAIAEADGEITNLSTNTKAIEAEIKELQDQILAIGGAKLRQQQSKVNDLKERLDHNTDRLTKAEVAGNKAEKDVAKYEKSLEAMTASLVTIEEDLNVIEKKLNDNQKASRTFRESYEAASGDLEHRKEELALLKETLDEKMTVIKKFRAREIELEQICAKLQTEIKENEKRRISWDEKLRKLRLHDIDDDDDDELDQPPQSANAQEEQPALVEGQAEGEDNAAPDAKNAKNDNVSELQDFTDDELSEFDVNRLRAEISTVEERIQRAKPNLAVLKEYRRREKEFMQRAKDLEHVTEQRDAAKRLYEDLRKQRLEEFMAGFSQISLKLKEMYQMITMGGNAELELVDSLDPFSEGIIFSVMPPKKSWKHISNLSGGEKTLSSLALVFALHVFKPTPLYFMDEIDAALDFRNVSIVANYISQRTKNAQFIIISLRNNMFELASRLVGIYKTSNCTKSVTIANTEIANVVA